LFLFLEKRCAKFLENLVLKKSGRGDHFRFKHPDGRKTVVPIHNNEDLGKGLLREILNQIDLSKEEYERLRRKA